MRFCNENKKPILTNLKQFSSYMLDYKGKKKRASD